MWTDSEIQTFIDVGNAEAEDAWMRVIPSQYRTGWKEAWREYRRYLVYRVSECENYWILIKKMQEIGGNPRYPTPPSPESQRELVDKSLAALWAQAL